MVPPDGRRSRPPAQWRQLLLAVVLVAALLTAAVAVDAPRMAGDKAAEPPVDDEIRQLHAAGVSGRNVSVGVLDPTGFDTDAPALAGRVAAARSFAPGEGPANGGRTQHGTAAATVVARTAPDADLYLATFDTSRGFREGLAWLVDREVDIVVAPLSFYGKGGRATAVRTAVERAGRRGVLVVTPTGNLGRSRWRGSFTPGPDGRHRFDGGARNYLLGGGERVRLWLAWADANRSFRVTLRRAGDDEPVAASRPFPGDGVPNARLAADVDPNGTYYAVVEGPPSANGSRVTLSSPSHVLQHYRRGGSVAPPATAPSALAVGAVGADGRVARFSAVGPVENRPGVDVVAPARRPAPARTDGSEAPPRRSFEGTSAAAAYAGGTAALVLSAVPPPAREPAVARGVLRTTATDLGPPGVDPASGAGRVDPDRAVARARNVTQNEL